MSHRRKTRNLHLADLPDDDAIVEAVRVEYERKAEYHRGYEGVTANEVAHRLGVEGAGRAGRGAVKGSWSGTMSPALRMAPALMRLAREGVVRQGRDHYSRWVYYPKGARE